MDPAWSLLASLFCLHVIEGALWIRRDAVVFRRGLKHWLRVSTSSPLGSAERVFVFAPWLRSHRPLLIVDPLPVWFAEDRVWNLSGGDTGPLGNSVSIRSLTRSEASRLYREGSVLRDPHGTFCKTSSPAMAQWVLDQVRRWAEGSPPSVRLGFQDDPWRPEAPARLRERLSDHERRSQVLRWLGGWFPWILLASTASFFFLPWAYRLWPAFAAVNAGIWISILVLFFRHHQREWPDLVAERWLRLLLFTAVPIAASRAHLWLTKDLFRGTDPICVAFALEPDESAAVLTYRRMRALRFPITQEAIATELDEALRASRGKHLEMYRQVIQSVGRAPDEAYSPPEMENSRNSYCPRCHEVYVDEAEFCAECPGVRRIRLAHSEGDTRPTDSASGHSILVPPPLEGL